MKSFCSFLCLGLILGSFSVGCVTGATEGKSPKEIKKMVQDLEWQTCKEIKEDMESGNYSRAPSKEVADILKELFQKCCDLAVERGEDIGECETHLNSDGVTDQLFEDFYERHFENPGSVGVDSQLLEILSVR